MIDYIKFHVLQLDIILHVKMHPDLEFHRNVDSLVKETGELKTKLIRRYLNMFFTFHDHKLEITGSLHKLKNNGRHNADDFTSKDCIEIIRSFCRKFQIPPSSCFITGLEFGINVLLNISVDQFLESIKFYNKKSFIRHHRLKKVFYSGSDYFELKVYNKSIQYPTLLNNNVVRFEWKTSESKYLKNKGCRTLEDLSMENIYKEFSKILLKSWDEVLVFDESKRKGKKFHHTEYWLDTINNLCNATFNNRKFAYYKCIGKNSIHNKVYAQFLKKLEVLNDCDFSTNFYKPRYVIQ